MHWRTLLSTFALAVAMPAAPLQAQGAVTIYRCTDSAGNVTVQNDTPCPAGTSESKRTLDGVPSASSPTATPVPARAVSLVPTTPPPLATSTPSATTAAGAASPAPAAGLTVPGVIPAASQPPPPSLYECRAPNGGVRWADAADPVERCATLLASGGVCDVDTSVPCVAVPAAGLCDRWEQRLRDLQLGGGIDAGLSARAEIARAEAVLSGTTCALTR